MNFGRESPIAQKNEIVQNGDSWFSLTPPGKLILPRSAPVPAGLQRNQRNRTWQDLLGMYSEILNHDVAVQTPNPTSVTSINRKNFDLIGVRTKTNQHLDKNVGWVNCNMNSGRGSPIAQKNEIVQNGDSCTKECSGKLILPRSAPVPVDLQGNRRNRNWQDLLGMYSEILNHDVAVQTPNPTSVTSINGRNFDLIGVGTEANQRLDRNADAYVQNFSNDSAGSCNNRPTKVLGIRTTENNNVLSSGQRNNGQISIRRTDSCTQVEGNWTELESTSLMFGRQHSIRRTDSNSCAQVASNWTELESTSLMFERQQSILGSNQRLNSLNTQVGSNSTQREANMLFGKQKCTVGSNQRFTEASSLHLPNNQREKQLDRQTPSERLNVSLDECSSQKKRKRQAVACSVSTSEKNENHPNEFSQVIVNAASAAISTPLKGTNIINEMEEHGLDLNKTPDQRFPKAAQTDDKLELLGT